MNSLGDGARREYETGRGAIGLLESRLGFAGRGRFNPRTRARASPQPSALYYGTSCSACGEGQAEIQIQIQIQNILVTQVKPAKGRREGRGTDLARGRNTAAKDRNAPSASRRAGAG